MKYLLIVIFFCSIRIFAQYEPLAKNSFLIDDVQQTFDYWNISRPELTFHSSFRPYLSNTYLTATDSLVPFKGYAFRNFFLSKTFNEKPQKRNWFNFQVHPIIDAGIGYDNVLNQALPEAIGGTHFKLNINNDFTFAASVFGGKTSLPFFLDTNIATQKILPAYGQAYGNNKAGYSFFDYNGYISYSPNNNRIFNFQLGRDKHFIGDGYRSVLLSDFAPAYPYFRIHTNLWRIQYSVWYTWMQDATYSNGLTANLQNKFGTFHYLSYNITKNINLGIFENIIWRGTDSNQVRGFEVNYLNPVTFYRPQEFSVGSPDNAFMGINFNAKILKKLKLYAQLGLDEFFLKEIRLRRGWWANKQAWQLGAKYINAFNLKGLSLQAEYNEVRPYTYTHGLPEQNYAHYRMPLAHPFGANFRELLGFVNYRKNNWAVSGQLMYALIGKDSLSPKSNIGQNISLSYTTRPFEFGHFTGQGIQNEIMQSTLKFTYYIIPAMNLRLELMYIQRSEKNARGYELQNPFFFVGIKTSFWNSYKDF
jgi:hypothetical protein